MGRLNGRVSLKGWGTLLLGLLLTSNALAGTVHVAVASNFIAPAQTLAAVFQTQTGHQVRLSSGSSGKLYAQIVNGAPYDVLLSADQDKPEALIRRGMAESESQFTYAIGQLVLWSPTNTGVDAQQRLRSGNFRKLALANPKLAPYGRAAREVLDYLALTDVTEEKWVMGENIAQTYQFVYSRNAELGFVAFSQLLSEPYLPKGQIWLIPTDWYQPILQDAVLLKQGAKNDAALDWLDFLKSAPVKQQLAEFGYLSEIPHLPAN